MSINDNERQAIVDAEHLRLLSIFYYVRAGVTGFYALFPIMHVIMGFIMIAVSTAVEGPGEEVPPALIGWFFVLIGLTIIIIGLLLAVLQFYAGRCIARRQRKGFCYVVAAISCLGIPYGTALGIFTFIVLGRPSVKTLFALQPPSLEHAER